jgi:hypothetical protein
MTALSLLVWCLISAVGCRAQERTPFARVSCRACINRGSSKYCVSPEGAYCDVDCYSDQIAMANRLDCLFASRRGGLWFSGIAIVALIVLCWKLAKHGKTCTVASTGTTTTVSVEPPGIRGRTGTPRFGASGALARPHRGNLRPSSGAAPTVPFHGASPELANHDATGSDQA